MKKAKQILFFFLLAILFSRQGEAQSAVRKTDSLKKILSGNIHDTVRIKALSQLARIYWVSKADTSAVLLVEALALAKKTGDKKITAFTLIYYGYALSVTSKYDSALATYKIAAVVSEEANDRKLKASALAGVGGMYQLLGEQEKAVEYLISALSEQEKCLDSSGMSKTLNSLALLFDSQNDFEQGLKYHKRSLAIKEKLDDQLAIANSLNNIGVEYMNLKQYDQSLMYLKRALDIRLKENDLTGLATTYNNIAGIYSCRNDHLTAIKYQLEGAKYFEQMGDEAGIAKGDYNLAVEYSAIEDYKTAENFLKKAEVVAEKYHLLELRKDIYGVFHQLYSNTGKYKEAYKYSKKYIDVKDSIFSEMKYHEMMSLTEKFESEKKEEQIKVLSQQSQISRLDAERSQLFLLLAGVGILVLILLAFFILRGYLQKRKANVLLSEKNTLIESQKNLVEEKNKAITDSITYAKRIQTALMASEKTIEKALSRLKD